MASVQIGVPRHAVDATGLTATWVTPRRVVWAVVAVGAALRAWVVGGGYFYWDDYIFQGRAARLPLDADYLLHGHDGHLMPGAFALQWVLTRLWPMDYVPLAIALILGQLLLVILFARLATSLWGDRWLVLVPVTVVAVTPLTLPTNTWWAAALNGIPMQLALVVGLSAGLRWSRTGRSRSLCLGVIVWLVLLSFSEKVLVVPWAVLAAAPLVRPDLSARQAWRHVMGRNRGVLLVCAVVTVGYVAAYVAVVGKAPSSDASAAQVSDLLARGFVTTVAPAMVGGPLNWSGIGFGSAVGQPPAWLVIVAGELVGGLVIWSAATSRTARRAWVWAGAYVLGDLLLLATGRVNTFVDPVIVQGLRYTADAAVPLALAVGCALAAIAPGSRRLMARAAGPGRDVGPWPRAGVLALVFVVSLLSVLSTLHYREIWVANPSREYVANASHDLAAAADGPSVVDQPVPVSVLYGLAFPYNQVSWVLSPVSPRPEFGDPTSLLRIFDESGHLRPALVQGPAAVPGPVPGCGWKIEGSQDIILQTEIVPFVHTVRVGYIATGDGTATLALGSAPARAVPIHRGLNEVVVTLEGGGDQLLVRDLTPGVTICTDDVRVGVPVVATP
jgi:hypothetical protein